MSNYRGFGGDDLPDPRKLLEPLKRNLRIILIAVILVVLAIGAMGSFFQVEPEEEAIVLRFGEPLAENFGSGLHFKIPIVDRVFKVPVARQHTLAFGYRSQPGKVSKVRDAGFDRESLMLTGDLMLVHVQWSVVYKIEDPRIWLFEVKDREETIRDISRAIMRQVIGDYSLDEVLTTKQREIETATEKATQYSLRDKVPTGVKITAVTIKSTDVPTAARKAFDDLNRTVAEVKRQLADAQAGKDTILGDEEKAKARAIGRAEKRLTQIVENARGEASAFLAKLKEYDVAPAITRQWMYLQSMTHVFRSLDEKIIIDEKGGGTGIVKLLPLKDLFGSGKLGAGITKGTARTTSGGSQ
jgi:membrane protease subunit HflK